MQPWRDFIQKHENDPKMYVMRQKAKKVKFHKFYIIIIITDRTCI